MPGYESLAKKTDQSHLDDVNEGSKLKKKTNKKTLITVILPQR